MESIKLYSHIRVQKARSKQKTPDREYQQKRMRSVTYDNDLLRSLSTQENLLDLIEREQRRRQVYEPVVIVPQMVEVKKRKIPKYRDDSPPPEYVLLDPSKKLLYQKMNIYGKFIESQPIKKFNLYQMPTLESAVSMLELEEGSHKSNRSKSKESDHVEQRQTLQYQYKTISYDSQQTEEQRMNQIINKALKKKQLKCDPVNASKSRMQQRAQMQNYLERQFKDALKNNNKYEQPRHYRTLNQNRQKIHSKTVNLVLLNPTRQTRSYSKQ
ncbi:hypothetical protein pb186bvf_010519 [Paramecium bursaria]